MDRDAETENSEMQIQNIKQEIRTKRPGIRMSGTVLVIFKQHQAKKIQYSMFPFN